MHMLKFYARMRTHIELQFKWGVPPLENPRVWLYPLHNGLGVDD